MRISDWSSDVCSSDLFPGTQIAATPHHHRVFIARCEQKMLPEGFGIGLSGIAVKIRLEQGSDAPQTARTSPQVGLPEGRSEEHTSELQSLMRISYAVFCLQKKKKHK